MQACGFTDWGGCWWGDTSTQDKAALCCVGSYVYFAVTFRRLKGACLHLLRGFHLPSVETLGTNHWQVLATRRVFLRPSAKLFVKDAQM